MTKRWTQRTRDEAEEPNDSLSRRDLLRNAGVMAAASMTAGLSGCSSDDNSDGDGTGGTGGGGTDGGGPGPTDGGACVAPPFEGDPGPESLFEHGVASGDPTPEAVILWTRVSPDGAASVDVFWEIAADPQLAECVASGTVTTNADADFTVKVDVPNLEPGQTYYYRFRALGRTSPVGRTRTAPSGAVDRLRFAVVSCSSLGHGYFHAYRAVAERPDLDAVIHLGDYIYEYGSGSYGDVRDYEPPHEIVTIEDYRLRHSQYKRDPDLQELHRQHPVIAIWDDHEVADNSWDEGALNHDPATEGSYADRKTAAQRAYSEWMPIRTSDPSKIWRKLAFGDLADLILLDTRLWARDVTTDVIAGPAPPLDPTRTLLGDDQAVWLEQQIGESAARWKLIGQQVMITNLYLNADTLVNEDQWMGYPASRERLLNYLRTSAAEDVIILTGDIHTSWAAELAINPNDPVEYDPTTGDGAVGVEFVAPAITSPGLDMFESIVASAQPFNPHVRYFNLTLQGYIILDVTHERTQAAWFLYDDITQPDTAMQTATAAWSVQTGQTRLMEDAEAAAPGQAPAAAP